MLRFLVILIVFMAPWIAQGGECLDGGAMVVTAPRSGVHTFNDSIAVRGFLCEDYILVVVKNRTTDSSVLTGTDQICEGGKCIYTFATFVDDLALGVNELTAAIPGQDPPIEVQVQVIRTTLAAK